MPRRGSLLGRLPPLADAERFEALLETPCGRVERIVSFGHASPPGFWYEQAEDEWVLLAAGSATLAFEDGTKLTLAAGDWIILPARQRHRVDAVSGDAVWLAVHLRTGQARDQQQDSGNAG
ncbi:cupin domain-containing protein [Azoarcus indigens]|uniref:Cupin type-2 domain-containing protein n=1 Tax=Azoarcus indigens TaxID=29545 RepID=A0A4R6DS31_9RHOO|nr:cupin domain-containing protein [Azoarcus indigens]NMG67520.1 cupin domain-containing protein [Azoarcus indigens]TDN47118.1 hypothetical protein C7389_12275 [Azoarcus indigens]